MDSVFVLPDKLSARIESVWESLDREEQRRTGELWAEIFEIYYIFVGSRASISLAVELFLYIYISQRVSLL